MAINIYLSIITLNVNDKGFNQKTNTKINNFKSPATIYDKNTLSTGGKKRTYLNIIKVIYENR